MIWARKTLFRTFQSPPRGEDTLLDLNFAHLRLPLLAALAVCAAAIPAHAATLNVPAQYGTIQAGITAAQPGDVVLLADGTYTGVGNATLDFGGKSITVASQNGAAKTIIDCQKQPGVRGVLFHSGEPAGAKLQGVTITNGVNGPGAGIEIIGSSPTITGCVLTGNSTGGPGGGLFANSSSHPVITGCAFINNTAGSGGGMEADGHVVVTGCTFTGNTAGNVGGGALFTSNDGVGSIVTGCTFTSNINSSYGGGGVYSATSFTSFTNCVFIGNICYNPDPSVGGGGFDGAGVLANCTFTSNTASAGAAVFSSGGTTIVTNSILFGDSGSEVVLGSTRDSVTYSDVQHGFAGAGNVGTDPQFVRSPDLAATPADYGDLHLRTTSPLIRQGTTVGAPTTTLDGVTRPAPPSIGAFEVSPALVPALADSYVLSSAPAQNSGTAPALVVGGFLGAAYLQFDLSRVSPLSAGSTVKLRLNASRPLAGTSSLVVSATSGFSESGLTFNNRPALGLPQGFINVTGGQGVAAYDVDVTAYVKSQQALGAAQVSLALTQFAPGLPVSIDSKENPANDGPQLVVTY